MYRMLLGPAVFIITFSGLHVAFCYNVTDEEILHEYLFSSYNKELRAGIDRNDVLNVSLTFYLFAIKEFVEVTGRLALNGAFSIVWKDERLSWDPVKFNNITETLISTDKIWKPQIASRNPFKDVFGLGNSLDIVHLYSNGTCKWSSLQSCEVICDADVTYYPFDKQYCTLKFLVTVLKDAWLNVTFSNSKADLSYYEENGLWQVQNTVTYSSLLRIYPHVVVGLYLQRRSTFYVVSLIIPLSFVTILQSFVFLLPKESGERLSFSVTLLLTNVVFLTIIQEKLPESSEPSIPILGFLILGNIILGAVVTLCVILSSNIHSIEAKDNVPNWLRRLCCIYTNKVDKKTSTEEKQDGTSTENPTTTQRGTHASSYSWKYIGKFFDKICFLFSVFLYAVQIIIYLAIVL